MQIRKMAAALLTAAALTMTGTSVFADGISIVIDKMVNDSAAYVDTTGAEPIMYDGKTFVPVRKVFEAAGFTVIWEESQETAWITVSAQDGSASPIEQYAYNALVQAGSRCIGFTPKDITVKTQVDSRVLEIMYNGVDVDGENISLGRTETMSSATMFANGTVMVPLRDIADAFGLALDWNPETQTAAIGLPSVIDVREDLISVVEYEEHPEDVKAMVSQTVEEDDPIPEPDPAKGEYIGRFKITHYAPGTTSNGAWGNATAWAGDITPGQTIAVDPSVIPKLATVYIDGYGYRRAEDCGGSVKGYHIDVAMPSYKAAMEAGVVYKDVWFA